MFEMTVKGIGNPRKMHILWWSPEMFNNCHDKIMIIIRHTYSIYNDKKSDFKEFDLSFFAADLRVVNHLAAFFCCSFCICLIRY